MAEDAKHEELRRIPPPDDADWWVERTAPGVWPGRTKRGATVLMATSRAGLPDAFSPGELLKLALAGCAAMSSEEAIARRLGADYPATIAVDGTEHETEDRYAAFDETFLLDLAGLDDAARETLATVIRRTIQHDCTVGLTLQNDVTITQHIDDASIPEAGSPTEP